MDVDNTIDKAINLMANKMVMNVQETEENFIFNIISRFAAREHQIVIEKGILVQAITLIKTLKEIYGDDILEALKTTTCRTNTMVAAYDIGFRDGVNYEHARVMGILNKVEEEDA